MTKSFIEWVIEKTLQVAGSGLGWDIMKAQGPIIVAEIATKLSNTVSWMQGNPAETIAIAKIKTLMQFSGGVAILGGHARVGELIGYGYVPEIITQESSALLINGGYLLVWSSIALMYRSLWNYWQNHKSARPT